MKKLLIILLLVFAAAQVIQPDRKVPPAGEHDDLFATIKAPPEIQSMVIGACYDCHSYRTDYPWYAYITPVNFWLQDHINEGREALNYSEWKKYAGSEHARESGEELMEGEMPPVNYARMHDHARLTAEQTAMLAQWFDANLGVKENKRARLGHKE
jgi:hypothetical protein